MSAIDESAPNWDQGQGLSWSGKWHQLTNSHHLSGHTLCGCYVYRRHEIWDGCHLQAIATGRETAPVCKKCERAAGVLGRGTGVSGA